MLEHTDTPGNAGACARLCIGIAGGSGAGKSTFTDMLVERLVDLRPAVLHQDRYFRDWAEVPEEEREARRTVNHPEGMAWSAFMANFTALRGGQPATEPAPGTRANARSRATGVLDPSPVVIVEGLFSLWHAELRAQLDLRLYLDAPDDERALRRMLRDVVTRGGDLERAAAWYRRDVLPNFATYTGASREHAHLIIPWRERNHMAVAAVAAWVRAELAARPHPQPLPLTREGS